MSSNNSAINLYCFLFVIFVLTVLPVVNLVPLLYRRRASIDDSLLLQIEIRWLVISSEVLNVKLEATKLDCVSSS